MNVLENITYCYENITPFQAALILAGLVLYFSYLILRDVGVPPGPRGLPLFGYWPFLNRDETCHLHLRDLGKKYGEVFSFRIAGTLLIRLGTLKSIREAHLTNSECFEGRYQDCLFAYALGDGVPFLNGEPLKVLRKFFVSKFKDYGLNTVKENTSTSVYDSLKEMVDELREAKGQPIPINDLITMKCIKIFRRIIFNDQGITEEELQAINEAYGEVMKGLTITNIMLIGKFAKYCMFPFMRSVRRLKSHSERIVDIVSQVIKRHKAKSVEWQDENLIDCYFTEKKEKQRKGDSTSKYFTDKALLDSLKQFSTDGLQTVSVFIANLLVHLLKYPEEQEKMYQEILDVVGTARLPSLEDKTKLTYTNAFIYEVARYTDFFPLFPSLQCTKETTVQGYRIPEGAVTLYDYYSAHRNPNDFENPEEFIPSRYVTTPGKERPDLPIIFGVGKRACIGEGFSMIQAFLFLTTIVQSFRLSFPEGSESSSFVFWSEDKLKICFHPRSHKYHPK